MNRAHTLDPQNSTIETAMLFIGIAGAAGTLFVFALGTPKSGLSVSCGALLALGNIWALNGIVRALLAPPAGTEIPEATEGELEGEEPNSVEGAPRSRFSIAWAVFAVFKMTLLFGAVYVVLARGWVAPLQLALGYMCMPLGILLSALWSSARSTLRRR